MQIEIQKTYLGQSACQLLKTAHIGRTNSGAVFVFGDTRDHADVMFTRTGGGNLFITDSCDLAVCVYCTPKAYDKLEELDEKSNAMMLKEAEEKGWL